jgi:hypothetical protein
MIPTLVYQLRVFPLFMELGGLLSLIRRMFALFCQVFSVKMRVLFVVKIQLVLVEKLFLVVITSASEELPRFLGLLNTLLKTSVYF